MGFMRRIHCGFYRMELRWSHGCLRLYPSETVCLAVVVYNTLSVYMRARSLPTQGDNGI